MNESLRKLHIEPRGQYVSFLSRIARRKAAGNERLRARFLSVVEIGESLDRRSELLGKYTTRFLSLALFMVPANIVVGYWEAQRAGIDLWLPWIFLILFDVILLSYVIRIARLALKAVWHGSPRMRFRDKMALRGGTLEVFFQGSRRLEDRGAVRAHLRCIEEQFVRSGRTQHLVCFERFKSQEQVAAANSEGVAAFRFDVPTDAPASNFSGILPTYWEVVVTHEETGPNYEGAFLAPVETVEERSG